MLGHTECGAIKGATKTYFMAKKAGQAPLSSDSHRFPPVSLFFPLNFIVSIGIFTGFSQPFRPKTKNKKRTCLTRICVRRRIAGRGPRP